MTSPPPVTPARASTTITPLRRSYPLSHSHLDNIHTTPRDDAKIYVLTADGSSMFLLDPSHPGENEEPPPYAALHTPLASPSPSRTSIHSVEARSPPHRLDFRRLHSSASLAIAPSPSFVFENANAGPSRHRANTIGAATRPRRATSTGPHRRSRPRLRGMQSGSGQPRVGENNERTPLLREESTPVETTIPSLEGRSTARSIICGDILPGDSMTWGAGFKRFWAPVGRGEYWYGLVHLVLLNFPFALVVWLPLLIGTLVGTALLITLPIGAAVWWLTLFIARSAARGEIRLQSHYHSPLDPSVPLPITRPIFYRLKPVSPSASPSSDYLEDQLEDPEFDYVWDKRFLKCSYAMFLDHYSYSALSYFLLIKPLLTLGSLLGCLVLLPVGATSILGLPIVLRATRRWGRWQAGVAIENLC